MIIMRKMTNMIKKFLVKLFLPNSKKLATIASEQICNAVNGLGKEKQISEIMKYVDVLADLQNKIATLLKDGKLDDEEKNQISKDLEPLISKLLKML